MNCSVAKKRSLVAMAVLFFITCGIYFFYWMVKTKDFESLIAMEATFYSALTDHPNSKILFLLHDTPKRLPHQYRPQSELVLYMLLLGLFPVVGMLVVQDIFNRSQRCCE